MACTPLGTTTPKLTLCKPKAGETGWDVGVNGNYDTIDSILGTLSTVAGVFAVLPPLRSYLAGCTLSTAGGSTTISIAAGAATDGGNATMLSIAAFTKTTASFVAGTGNGALDTGASLGSASTWYHLWLISTAGGALTDILMSLSATAPTMPATYTLKRRIGAAFLDGSKNWTAFIQDGDFFQWSAPTADISATNPGTAAVTRTMTVPTGVNVLWYGTVGLAATTAGTYTGLITDLATNDTAPAFNTANISTVAVATAESTSVQLTVRTNTSAQVRSRISVSDATVSLGMSTIGWFDRRGRDS